MTNSSSALLDGTSYPDRMDLHRQAVALVRRRLIKQGLHSTTHKRLPVKAGPGDLLVEGKVWVAVRAATPGAKRKVIICPRGGKRYEYAYKLVFFNLASHNRRRMPPHVWALVRMDTHRVYVLPQNTVGTKGLTVALVANPLRMRSHGRSWVYRGEERWQVVREAVAAA